jgi:hypothetical protein
MTVLTRASRVVERELEESGRMQQQSVMMNMTLFDRKILSKCLKGNHVYLASRDNVSTF